MHIIPLAARIISSLSLSLFFYFLYASFFYFCIVLKFVPSHEIHHRVFCPPARVDFPDESFQIQYSRFKSIQCSINITHCNAKTIQCISDETGKKILYSRCENGLSACARYRFRFGRFSLSFCSLLFPFLNSIYYVLANRSVITPGTNRRVTMA